MGIRLLLIAPKPVSANFAVNMSLMKCGNEEHVITKSRQSVA